MWLPYVWRRSWKLSFRDSVSVQTSLVRGVVESAGGGDIPVVERCPLRGLEDIVLERGTARAEGSAPVRAEPVGQHGERNDVAGASACLELHEARRACAGAPSELTAHTDHACLEIDVLPAQSKELLDPQPRVDGRREQHAGSDSVQSYGCLRATRSKRRPRRLKCYVDSRALFAPAGEDPAPVGKYPT